MTRPGISAATAPTRLAPGSQNWHQFPISAGVPAFFTSASGPCVYEASGRELVDLYCGSGATILGHGAPAQVEAVRAVLDSGATVSLRHPAEPELAEHLVALCPGTRYAAFFKTGSEAVHAAVTSAVRATGRRAVLTTTYHGWLLPLGDLRDMSGFRVVPLDWTSPTLVADVAKVADLAACLVVSPTTELPDPEVVRAVVRAARATGAVIIFDEVKAGFRYAYPTVATTLDIEPDLIVVSKAIGNGFPIAALLGGDLLANVDTFSVYSTYASEIVSIVASLACLRALADGAYEAFATSSAAMYEALRALGARYGVGVQGVPTFFRLVLPDGADPDELCRGLYQHGVLYHPLDQVIVSAAHGPDVRDRVCVAMEATLAGMHHG
jgi:Glutamate-1-semialdehyde aminotransferase